MWGSIRLDHCCSSMVIQKDLQEDKARRLRPRSKVSVKIRTFKGAEKESESEGGIRELSEGFKEPF